ncbi:MAG TPA: class I SAM-dependent methyltransferase [Planctomycetota bacterium]|nr:class I SAM-dependent methyltransferase [Planctomycetota bacterium]
MKRNTATTAQPWYVRAFKADYLARYKHRSDAQARRELPFILKELKLPARATVLDLCCGAGRHACAMAGALRRGRVIALDLSLDLLRAAQAKNSARRRLHFIRGDMRRIPLANARLDGVINLFTSFGYFKTDGEHLRVLKEVVRVLKPGGRLVLDFFNRAHVLATLVRRSESVEPGRTIVMERRYDAKARRLVKTIRVADGCAEKKGRQECRPAVVLRESVRAYSFAELKRLLVRAGLSPVGLYGDLNGAEFDPETSPRCVWVAEKATAS